VSLLHQAVRFGAEKAIDLIAKVAAETAGPVPNPHEYEITVTGAPGMRVRVLVTVETDPEP